MWWSDWGPWPMWFQFPLIPIIFMVVCVLIMMFVMMPMMRRRHAGSAPERTALDILNERFAKGEIDKAEYEQKRRLISL